MQNIAQRIFQYFWVQGGGDLVLNNISTVLDANIINNVFPLGADNNS